PPGRGRAGCLRRCDALRGRGDAGAGGAGSCGCEHRHLLRARRSVRGGCAVADGGTLSARRRTPNSEPAPSLFAAAVDRPLADRMRPRTLDEVVGQPHLLGPGKPLREMLERGIVASLIFWGPPGTGKTTLGRLIASHTDRAFVPFSAVTEGV